MLIFILVVLALVAAYRGNSGVFALLFVFAVILAFWVYVL